MLLILLLLHTYFVISSSPVSFFSFFFFNDTATTEIYTLSLHDALPICLVVVVVLGGGCDRGQENPARHIARSEEHTSELQSRPHLVCRLLLEKKKKKKNTLYDIPQTKRRVTHTSLRTHHVARCPQLTCS